MSYYVKILLMAALSSVMSNVTALAGTKCIPGDWQERICHLQPTPSPRCADDAVAGPNFSTMCAPGPGLCAKVGGCFGTLAPDEWFATPFDDNTTRRCQCGCFAQETVFKSLGRDVTGTDLIKLGVGGSAQLLSTDRLGERSVSLRSVKSIVWGPEKLPSFKIRARNNHRELEVVLTRKHPVVIADEDGKLKLLKAASEVVTGDLLLDDEGATMKVVSVEQIDYKGQVVNFKVDSEDGVNHFVSANSLQMGDNAWQQVLATKDSRILDRAEIELFLNDR